MEEILEQVNRLVKATDSRETLEQLRDRLKKPFNDKINAIIKSENEAKRQEREGAAQKLCEALKPGDKVLMAEHGYLNLFNPGGKDVFYDAGATVYAYQPRKKILWLSVTGTKGAKEKFKQQRAFRLPEVASYNVRRKAE